MAKNSSQAITGNNTFNQGFYLINEEKDFRSLPLGINICATKDSIKIFKCRLYYCSRWNIFNFCDKGNRRNEQWFNCNVIGFFNREF